MCKLCVRSIQASPSLALEQCTVSSNKCALQLPFPFCERKQSGGKREACCLGIYLNFFFVMTPKVPKTLKKCHEICLTGIIY